MHAALTFQPASLQTHFGGVRRWMCLQTLDAQKMCFRARARAHGSAVLLQPFAERGRMLGLIFRPAAAVPLGEGRALFGKTNANTFSVLSGGKTTTGGLNG